MNISRRTFIGTSAEIVTCASLAAGLQSCRIGSLLYSSGDIPVLEGPAEILIEQEPVFQTTGGAVKKRFAGINNGNVIIIVRISDQSFVAYAAQCTHWGAEVELPHKGIMVCPFHGSRYDADDGSDVEGPAVEALPNYSIFFDKIQQRLTIAPKG